MGYQFFAIVICVVYFSQKEILLMQFECHCIKNTYYTFSLDFVQTEKLANTLWLCSD